MRFFRLAIKTDGLHANFIDKLRVLGTVAKNLNFTIITRELGVTS